jgi:hypothetical protein
LEQPRTQGLPARFSNMAAKAGKAWHLYLEKNKHPQKYIFMFLQTVKCYNFTIMNYHKSQ